MDCKLLNMDSQDNKSYQQQSTQKQLSIQKIPPRRHRHISIEDTGDSAEFHSSKFKKTFNFFYFVYICFIFLFCIKF